VLAAVTQDGFALWYAADELRADIAFCTQLVAVNGHAISFVGGKEEEEYVMLALFPHLGADDIVADIKAASAAYKVKMLELVARANACNNAKDAANKAVLETEELATTKAARDFEVLLTNFPHLRVGDTVVVGIKAAFDRGVKACRAAIETAKATVRSGDAPPPPPAGRIAGDTFAAVEKDAEAFLKNSMSKSSAFAVGDPAKFGRLAALLYGDLAGTYRVKSNALLKADDFDQHKEYDAAATAAAKWWGLEPGLDQEGWDKWFPSRQYGNEEWGPLMEEEEEEDA
jgi:hypothetical protein